MIVIDQGTGLRSLIYFQDEVLRVVVQGQIMYSIKACHRITHCRQVTILQDTHQAEARDQITILSALACLMGIVVPGATEVLPVLLLKAGLAPEILVLERQKGCAQNISISA